MELYTLDSLLRRTTVVEGYESYIWTERYTSLGDFQMVIASSVQNRNRFAIGTYMGLSESRRVMQIETIEDKEDDSGTKKLTITGTELSQVLQDRVADTGLLGSHPGTWTYTDTARNTMTKLFDLACRNGNATDKIPLLVDGSLYPAGNLQEDTTVYTFEREYSGLYAALKDFADSFDLGFRLYKGDDDSKLYWDIYKGKDRTSSQNVNSPVIFSPDLDSLQAVSSLVSIATSKNVAYVMSGPGVGRYVYGDGASTSTAGFAKRTLFVQANDIVYPERPYTIASDGTAALNKLSGLVNSSQFVKDSITAVGQKKRLTQAQVTALVQAASDALTANLITSAEKTSIDNARTQSVNYNTTEDAQLNALMDQRGKEELQKNRSISAFDGEITQLSPYKYGTHYGMGDLVEMRNSDGLTNQMLVSEQIFVSDLSGERAYPTLVIKRFITPGSWLAWENSQVWQDAPGTWATAST